mgnify:CR=1 FL=1
MRSTSTSTIYSIKSQHQFDKYNRKTTSKKTGIDGGTSFKRMIGDDMMITIGQMIIGGTIINVMIIDATTDTMTIDEKMTNKMSIGGIVVTTMTIHQGMIEMITTLTKIIDIMMIKDPMIKGEMMTIDNLIIDSMTIDGMTIGDPRHFDNSNIILKLEMSRNHRMFSNHVMRMENLVGHQYLIATFAEKMDTMQISV